MQTKINKLREEDVMNCPIHGKHKQFCKVKMGVSSKAPIFKICDVCVKYEKRQTASFRGKVKGKYITKLENNYD